jgi:hypothetical protein
MQSQKSTDKPFVKTQPEAEDGKGRKSRPALDRPAFVVVGTKLWHARVLIVTGGGITHRRHWT